MKAGKNMNLEDYGKHTFSNQFVEQFYDHLTARSADKFFATIFYTDLIRSMNDEELKTGVFTRNLPTKFVKSDAFSIPVGELESLLGYAVLSENKDGTSTVMFSAFYERSDVPKRFHD